MRVKRKHVYTHRFPKTVEHPLDYAYTSLACAVIESAWKEIDDIYAKRFRERDHMTDIQYENLVKNGDATIRTIGKFFTSDNFTMLTDGVVDGERAFQQGHLRIRKKWAKMENLRYKHLVFKKGDRVKEFRNPTSAMRFFGIHDAEKLHEIVRDKAKNYRGWTFYG